MSTYTLQDFKKANTFFWRSFHAGRETLAELVKGHSRLNSDFSDELDQIVIND